MIKLFQLGTGAVAERQAAALQNVCLFGLLIEPIRADAARPPARKVVVVCIPSTEFPPPPPYFDPVSRATEVPKMQATVMKDDDEKLIELKLQFLYELMIGTLFKPSVL